MAALAAVEAAAAALRDFWDTAEAFFDAGCVAEADFLEVGGGGLVTTPGGTESRLPDATAESRLLPAAAAADSDPPSRSSAGSRRRRSPSGTLQMRFRMCPALKRGDRRWLGREEFRAVFEPTYWTETQECR